MLKLIASAVLALSFLVTQYLWANTQPNVVRVAATSELFGLPFNNLKLTDLEEHLKSMGVEGYPSYQEEGVESFSLGPEGILGVTDLIVYSNDSGFIEKALLSGVVESDSKRSALGELLFNKYGVPSVGSLTDNVGEVEWWLRDYTKIMLKNTTFDVSVMYVDERPRVINRSGRIDVESLSRNN
ncbi:uridine kinase [Marinomonas sp. THO17]|uniref:uridine kinase n=1 Tax=Marinomonas sp. THO17 TaxID=3149048 RepID=UPI00336BCCDD